MGADNEVHAKADCQHLNVIGHLAMLRANHFLYSLQLRADHTRPNIAKRLTSFVIFKHYTT